MEKIIFYIFKACIASGILYAYYLAALRNKKIHFYNRVYLLTSVVISIVVPFVHIPWYPFEPAQNFQFAGIINSIKSNNPAVSTPDRIAPESIIVTFFGVVSLILLFMLFTRIIRIFRIKQAGKITVMHGYDFIETDARQAPFSFLNNLFWKKGMSLESPIGKKIYNHELTHIRQGHSYDKLFTHLVLCIFWMNPIYWIIQKELGIIHEFMADKASVEEGDGKSLALMLLQSHIESRFLAPAHPFFNSSVKRRLFMITSSEKHPFSNMQRGILFPVAVFVVVMFTMNLIAQKDVISNGVILKNGLFAFADTAKIVDHIEIHGETGKGDTGIVFFKNGTKEIYILNKPEENKIFKHRYEKLMFHPKPPLMEKQHSEPEGTTNHIQYEPLDSIPGTIAEITFGKETIWLKLKDGTSEQYDLNRKEEKKDFESKYGKLKINNDI